MIYIRLFLEFFKIGLFSIGGGLATLPFIQQLIGKYGWLTNKELLNMIAISESTPGPIGVNVATFVGYNAGGILGGVIATLGLVAPSIVIVVLLAHYFMKFDQNPIVKAGLAGIRPAVAGLIGFVAFEIGREELLNQLLDGQEILDLFNFQAIILFTIILYLINRYEKHPLLYLVGAAFIGVIFRY